MELIKAKDFISGEVIALNFVKSLELFIFADPVYVSLRANTVTLTPG